MTYKIWNKVDDINGVNASVILKRHNIKKEDEIFLVLDGNRVIEMQFKNIIKNTYNIASDDIEEVAQEYIKIKEDEKLQAEKEQISLKEQQEKISILEAENEKLNTQLSTVRASHSDLILDLDFRVMDIEDNLGLVPMNINLFKALGEDDMNSTFMVVLDKIETGSYNTKEEIESICDRYLARGRITGEEYDMLMKALDKKESEKNEII